MSKILILGGHGFVGNNLYQKLKGSKHKLFRVSRKDGVDLKNLSSTKDCLRKINPEVIFNCAAAVGSVHYVSENHADIVNDNMLMNLNLYRAVVEFCPKSRIINPIANCAYPGNAQVYKEVNLLKNDVHESVYSYGHAKRMLYVISYCYKKQYGISSINFLVPNLFGPGDDLDPNRVHALDGIIIRMIESHRKSKKEFEIWGTGKPIREWAYIDDFVEILIAALSIKEDLIYPVNFAQNKGYSIKESARFIARALGYKGRFTFNTNYQDGAPIKIMDDRRFRRLFPQFKFTAHEEAIRKTVKYYLSILGGTN